MRSADDEACVVLQLETRGAIGRLREIAAAPGVDALFVGPGDFAAGVGEIGDIAAPLVQDASRDAAAAARRRGKPAGIVGPKPRMVRRCREWGHGFVAIASDPGMMTARAGEMSAAPAGESAGPAQAGSAW